MTKNAFPAISPYEDDRQVRDKLNETRNGKLNATGDITVSSGTTTTTVQDKRVSGDSVISLMALDSASADMSTFYFSQDATNGTFTITHNSAGGDRTYSYTIIG